MNILWQNQAQKPALWVVDKPAGLNTTPPKNPPFDCVEYLFEKEQAVEKIFAVHRLDRDTSGALLLTRNKKWLAELQEAFHQRQIKKEYVAICEINTKRVESFFGVNKFTINKKWKVHNLLVKESSEEKGFRMVNYDFDLGKNLDRKKHEALTEFEVLEIKGRIVKIRALPQTGRTHQIRSHLAHCGLSIVGDIFYGEKTTASTNSYMLLHSEKLSFLHPETKKLISVQAPLPIGFNL